MRISNLIGNINWFGYNQSALIEQTYHMIVQMLINSELTSNFPTPKIWQMLESDGALKNMWARGATTDDKYGGERNTGELRLFGGLSADVSQAPTGVGRPYYIALSPGSLIQGAAPYYGRSYVVYKEAVKTRCTFTATDSLQLLKQPRDLRPLDICNISTIGNILARVSDRQLRYLCALVGCGEADNPNEFIEAQGWGTMNLAKDVEAIVISTDDLDSFIRSQDVHSDLIPEHMIGKSAVGRTQDILTLRAELGRFCGMNGIKLVYLPLGPNTMNSREKRPD